MPTYDMKCKDCGEKTEVVCKIAERKQQVCMKLECGASLIVILNSSYAVAPFKSGYFEHIALEPIYCGSKRQLRGECDKRGLTSIYASEW